MNTWCYWVIAMSCIHKKMEMWWCSFCRSLVTTLWQVRRLIVRSVFTTWPRTKCYMCLVVMLDAWNDLPHHPANQTSSGVLQKMGLSCEKWSFRCSFMSHTVVGSYCSVYFLSSLGQLDTLVLCMIEAEHWHIRVMDMCHTMCQRSGSLTVPSHFFAFLWFLPFVLKQALQIVLNNAEPSVLWLHYI